MDDNLAKVMLRNVINIRWLFKQVQVNKYQQRTWYSGGSEACVLRCCSLLVCFILFWSFCFYLCFVLCVSWIILGILRLPRPAPAMQALLRRAWLESRRLATWMGRVMEMMMSNKVSHHLYPPYIHTHAHLNLIVWLNSLWIRCFTLQYMHCKYALAFSLPMNST